jgi:hypothetical protein
MKEVSTMTAKKVPPSTKNTKREEKKQKIQDQLKGNTAQPDFKTYKPTALEVASRDLILGWIAIQEAKDAVADRFIPAIISALEEAGRTSIVCEGYTIAIETKAATRKVSVKKLETN